MTFARTLAPSLIAASLTAFAGHVLAQPIALAPHRAVYELVLDPTKTGMKIDRAGGRIAFELTGSTCEGYTVALRQVTELDTGEGKLSTSDLHSTTWEASDAQSYRFESRNVINDEEQEEVAGSAERTAGGGLMVQLTSPKPETFEIEGKVALPTEHLVKLLAAAAAGERIFETPVYDGASDGKKVYDTFAVIGSAVTEEPAEEAAKKPELANMKRYPMTVSYFEPGVGERTPAYILGFELYENGVSGALRLDYGDFALRGELSTLEFLKPTACNP